MYLKSLTLQGFKSFAQRVELLFPQGVTAIVGPNGSGKSNVSDAIRWVLGEQNVRSLRGSAMQDVIFAGTRSRKPLGMAEVSMTLDNTDFTLPLEYAEITITRRTYRSGESEFFINRTSCRLRDIHDLLMDTGLGRGTLSVIGQGEVDAILSVRPEERRTLIEEAAGITRYRSKRHAALERLKETESDLTRLGDIIAEVERQFSPLEKEAERATRHKELKARLASVETKVLLHDWAVRKEACTLWEARRHKAEEQWEAAKASLASVQDERRESLGEAATLQEELERAQAALNQHERSSEHHGAQAQVLGERLGALQADLARRTDELHSLGQQITSSTARLHTLKEHAHSLRSQVSEAHSLFTAAEAQVQKARERIERTDSFLGRVRSQAMSHIQRAADVQAELRRMETSITERQGELEHRREELQAFRAQLEATRSERDAVTTSMDELGKARSDLQALADEIGGSLSELEAARRRLVEGLQSLRGRYTGVRTQHDALRELDESFEGFGEGVRACLKADRPWRDQVYGAVGSLLQVPPEYEIALEVALGGASQNIVVADEVTAKRAIEYLRQTRAGRVTFLPLTSLRVSAPIVLPYRLEQDPECIGIASQLVRFDPEIARAVEFLLGRVLVTRTLDSAVRLNRSHPQIQRVVSLEGDLVLASGPITGGHRRRREGTGLLSRSRRLAELAAESERLAREVKDHEEQLEQLDHEIQQARTEKSKVEGRLQSVLREMADQQRVSDVLGERLQAARQQMQRTEAAIEKLQEGIRQLTLEHDEVSKQLGSLDTDKELQSSQVEQLEQQLALLRAESDQLEDVRSQRRAEWVDLAGALKRAESELEQAEANLTDLTKRQQTAQGECAALEERIATTETEMKQALSEAASFRVKAEEDRVRVSQLQEELSRFQKAIAAWNEKEEVARFEVESASSELHKVELALERERVAYTQAEERLTERGIAVPAGVEGAKVDRVEPLKAEVRSLRQQLDELGDVNLNALEEFAALKERYTFLTEQRQDLHEAREGLDRAIAEMDQVSTERLLTAFDAIQKALHNVFPRLFGGGRAELSWTDPERPLESGIDMLVQPPGKRPQPLLTLSGGERALAAASLLFAIMTVRPSPFFVLDEVDAALDEANVDRFAQLLHEYGKENQIIVITHRQGTMERADALFGVTMERHGASQLVSLRLGDAVSVAP